MRSAKVDSLMVIEGKTNKLIGIINAKEIQLQSDRSLEAGKIMKTDIISVGAQECLVDILKIVEDNKISAIPVLEDDRRIIGLITKSSLVTTLSQQFLNTDEQI
jgi:osmoprotectant transport system ATP-binding protein